MLQKAFAIGNSVAVTLPRRWGITPGTHIRGLQRRRNRLSYEIVEEPKTKRSAGINKVDKNKETDEYIKRVTGAIKLNMSTEEFMKLKSYYREHPYEKI